MLLLIIASVHSGKACICHVGTCLQFEKVEKYHCMILLLFHQGGLSAICVMSSRTRRDLALMTPLFRLVFCRLSLYLQFTLDPLIFLISKKENIAIVIMVSLLSQHKSSLQWNLSITKPTITNISV